MPAAVRRTSRRRRVPEYRIPPNLKQVVVSSNMWQSARSGGPFLFIQALLTTATIPTYLRNDWYRDWGALERYIQLVPASEAPNAVVDQGSKTVFGLGPYRTDQGLAVIGAMTTDSRGQRPRRPATSRSPAGWPPSPG